MYDMSQTAKCFHVTELSLSKNIADASL